MERRDFLRTLAAAGLSLAIPGSVGVAAPPAPLRFPIAWLRVLGTRNWRQDRGTSMTLELLHPTSMTLELLHPTITKVTCSKGNLLPRAAVWPVDWPADLDNVTIC